MVIFGSTNVQFSIFLRPKFVSEKYKRKKGHQSPPQVNIGDRGPRADFFFPKTGKSSMTGLGKPLPDPAIFEKNDGAIAPVTAVVLVWPGAGFCFHPFFKGGDVQNWVGRQN